MEEAKTVLSAERATVFLIDKKAKILWSKVALGTEAIRVPDDKGIVGSVFVSGQLENIPDAYKDSRFNPEVDKKTGYVTRSILTAPMKDLHGGILGVFQVLNKKTSGPFSAQDEKILTILTSQAAVAIENLRPRLRKRWPRQQGSGQCPAISIHVQAAVPVA